MAFCFQQTSGIKAQLGDVGGIAKSSWVTYGENISSFAPDILKNSDSLTLNGNVTSISGLYWVFQSHSSYLGRVSQVSRRL